MEKANEVVLVGGSAGSYTLITDMMAALPETFSPAIIIVIHRNPRFTTKIEDTLSTRLQKEVVQAADKAAILKGGIYFAAPGYHLLVEPDKTFSLDISERIHFSRPSIDVLFETAADVFLDRCTAFLLSGANQDGTDGIRQLQRMGAKVIVQSPTEASISTMPKHAIEASERVDIYSNRQILSYFRNLK
ncbi:chemotaxis protein CheB [Sphingobacterium sp. DN00404]|uniref:protein-glutamate methylesterase n=1 Tax=Sphingobacterium micropteri TaxID=2763501 RepID=A0ABR7YRA4_9SPHI|nr:chemotaxis protein CheB [Sphingobacterium micropteri]MBD1433869.1 chemotaxis protein CheB [Sphingobacterium micropteri]